MTPLYRPPAPVPQTPVRALVRGMVTGERDLLSLLPGDAYRLRVGKLGFSRRGILFVNDPDAVRQVMAEETDAYPKNDLFVGALKPLVGNGVFISTGETWQRQRRMVSPAFSHMHVGRAFEHMAAAVADYMARWEQMTKAGQEQPIALDEAMSHLTADVVCRALFSQRLEDGAAKEIFADFEVFQKTVANVDVGRLIFGKAWADVPQPADAVAACTRIRAHLQDWIAPRLAAGAAPIPDTVGDIVAARDAETGEGFTLEELVDQIGVLFLAGHETTASTVTWVLYILSQVPEALARVREEVETVVGDGPIDYAATKQLPYLRNVMRETLRLYPPGPFLPRVALEPGAIAGHRIPRGGMVMISPWLIHRHPALWENPDRFDPDRFQGKSEKDLNNGAYLPFGLGPRVCIGAAFATVEGVLILANILRRFDVTPVEPVAVRPVARLTIRPADSVMVRVTRRHV